LAERFPGAPLSSFLQPLCCWGLLPEPLQPSHNTVCSFLPRIAGLARPALGISLLFGFSRPPGSHPRPPGALPPRGTDIVSARPGLLRPQPAAIRHSLARCWKTARCHSARVNAAAKAFLCPILDAVNVWLSASPEDLAELLFTTRRGTPIDASRLSQ